MSFVLKSPQEVIKDIVARDKVIFLEIYLKICYLVKNNILSFVGDEIMKCLILAAGYATRLYPLTENFPKPLLDVGGKTIVDWLIDDLRTANVIDEFIVISNHKFAHHFEDWAKEQHYTKKITVIDDGTSTNETRIGAVRDLQYAIEKANVNDDLLVVAADNLLFFSFSDFVKFAKFTATDEEKINKKMMNIDRYTEDS